MRRWIAPVAVGVVAVVSGSVGAAGAQPTTDTRGCQTVASKYVEEDAAGHHGIQNAAGSGAGEGPCGFGNPPGQE